MSNKFHRYYLKGLQLLSFKIVTNKFLDIFTDRVQMVNKLTHISGSFIDHIYIKKALMEEYFTNVTIEKISFSDHDAVKNCYLGKSC